MEATVLGELARRCAEMKDRRRPNCRHPLANVLVMAIVAVLCGADGWSDVAEFARAEARWFGLFLPLKHGTPSRQTFERVFALLKPEALEACLRQWVELMRRSSGGAIGHVAIDGKALRRSFQHLGQASSMAYLVSAFASESGLVMAQTHSSHGRGGELGAIRRLLDLLNLKGCMVTIDAGGCQRDVAERLRQEGADYCLALKENQRTLYGLVRIALSEIRRQTPAVHESQSSGHGRTETRRVWVSSELQRLGETGRQWPGLAGFALVESCREVKGKEPSRSWRYYLLSRVLSAAEAQTLIRSHWSIENRLHYVLDVTYHEDASRIQRASAAQFSRLRRLTLNMLRSETTQHGSIASKRRRCGWNREYRVKVLASSLAMAI